MGKWGAWGLVGVLALLLLTAVISGPLCGPGGGGNGGPAPGGALDAKGKLDPKLAKVINQQAARFRVDPHVVGAIALRETNGGKAIACSAIANTACGAMQLTKGWWGTYHCDGNRNGRESIDEIEDNVCASIKGMLKLANPLKRRLMTRPEVMGMAKNYCGACQDINCGKGVDGGYCESIARNVKRLGGTFGTGKSPEALDGGSGASTQAAGLTPAVAAPGTCPVPGANAAITSAAATGNGKWRQQLEKPNRPGVPPKPILVAFLNEVAEYTPYEPVVTIFSGGQHSAGSAHYTGNAADFGSVKNAFGSNNVPPGVPNKRGDALAAAALIAAGVDPGTAKKKARQGLRPGPDDITFRFKGQRVRVQVIWKYAAHTDHVHIGIKPV